MASWWISTPQIGCQVEPRKSNVALVCRHSSAAVWPVLNSKQRIPLEISGRYWRSMVHAWYSLSPYRKLLSNDLFPTVGYWVTTSSQTSLYKASCSSGQRLTKRTLYLQILQWHRLCSDFRASNSDSGEDRGEGKGVLHSLSEIGFLSAFFWWGRCSKPVPRLLVLSSIYMIAIKKSRLV